MSATSSGASGVGSIPPLLITSDHFKQLIRGQRNNRRFYIVVLVAAIAVSVGLFAYLVKHQLLSSVGPILGSLPTFVSSFFPAKEMQACNDRITKLNFMAEMLGRLIPGTEQAKLYEETALGEILKL